MNILLIEDDAGLVELITANLEELDFSVISAASGVEALAHLEKHIPDLMLLDYSLPDINGKELIETLINQQTALPPFIITTGQGDERIAVDMMKLGARDYLIKDILFLEKLPAVVKRVIKEIESDDKIKHIEESLRKSEDKYRSLVDDVLDTSLVGIFILDSEFKVAWINRATEKYFGIKKEDVIGKDKQQLINSKIKMIFEDPKYFTKKVLDTYAKNNYIESFECHIIQGKDREDRWLSHWSQPITDGLYKNGRIEQYTDITERKQAEDDIRRLSTAVEQSPSMVVITDTEGKLEYVNPKFTELTGYSSAEAIGQKSNILKSGVQDIEFYKEMWQIIESGKVWRGQFHNKKKNGELFWEAASISGILNESGEVINFIKMGEDITQQKITEAELKIALEKALESDRLKSAFLSNMSHEIRTPMNGVLGFINLLNEPNLSKSKISKYSEIINKSGTRLLNTINDIIDISKIEAGEVVLTKNETFIDTEIEELYSFFLPEANKKGLSLFVEPASSSRQLMVITDSHKLHGVLTNLIKNAIKYTERGHITFGYSLKDDFIEFFVEDTGIGIPKNRLQAIFNRFEQADIEDKSVFEGSGLGLAISKAYTEMLGGEIFVESTEGEGSKFTFTIPYNKKSGKEVVKLVENIDVGRKEINKLNLLIVEDDAVSSEFLKCTLEGIFKDIIIVENGKDAIEICRDNPNLDLVLMDIKIPIVNGYEATKEIRKFNKDLLIIAQTAYVMHGDREKAIEAGCNDYISKPIDKELLLEIINTLL